MTVGDINSILSCLKNNTIAPKRLHRLVNRLVPFAKSIPGTSLAFKNEKKRLHSIVASPLYDGKPWRWFVTFSNADLFEEYLYRMICSDFNGEVKDEKGNIIYGEAGQDYLRALDVPQRRKLLRDHPALAARSYVLKQDLIMKYIVGGDKTFGHLEDSWIRVEFQRSLNAHLHIILSVRDEEHVEDLAKSGMLLAEGLAKLLKSTCTAEVSMHFYLINVYLSITIILNVIF